MNAIEEETSSMLRRNSPPAQSFYGYVSGIRSQHIPAVVRHASMLTLIPEEDPDPETLPDYFSSSSSDRLFPDIREPSLSPTRSRSPSPRSSDSVSFPRPYSTVGVGNKIAIHSSPAKLPQPLRVYFDSPTEDPVGSDPLEKPDYELDLDYDNLDFTWEKFDRSGLDLEMHSLSGPLSIVDEREEGGTQDDPMAVSLDDLVPASTSAEGQDQDWADYPHEDS
ncbi:hypothetical protein EUX98_g6334 [Antrodiella citrinella]|uniref:Uncharacterized protein n=1 Tax=Antrodiella citrinella TaxID=2447956 RepID=A0A4S4MPC4_9APHY|nr:hypothetical protein EUX98_g6334 [Antrodiella citrinella]